MKHHQAAWERVLTELEASQLRRQLTSLEGHAGSVLVRDESGKDAVAFASNDYLGLAHHPEVVAAAVASLERHGLGSGASRLITGTHPAHHELEQNLASFKGIDAALTFSSGYATALGFASAFLSKDSVVLLDKLSHACLIDACRLAGSQVRVFRHNDLDKLEHLLKWAQLKTRPDQVFVITESVFSMDGDVAPLASLVALKERFGAQLLLDEAHAIGVLGPQGRGLAAALGLSGQIEFHMGTLGKALGTAGGYLGGSRSMVEVLVNKARSFIYSTAPPPALAAATTAAIRVCQSADGDARRQRLGDLAAALALGLGAPVPLAAILPYHVGSEGAALDLALGLRSRGFYVPAIRYPTVGRGQARLRFTLSAGHTPEQIDSLTRAVQDYHAMHGAE